MLPRVWEFIKAHWRPFAVVLGLVLAFLAGRQSNPAKTVTKTQEKVVYRDRVVEKLVQNKSEAQVRTRIVYRDRTVTTKPDGTVEKRDVVKTEVGATATKSETTSEERRSAVSSSSVRSSEKTVEAGKPQWHVSATVGLDLRNLAGSPVYGGRLERRIAGPLWLGAFGASNGVAGLSLGLEF